MTSLTNLTYGVEIGTVPRPVKDLDLVQLSKDIVKLHSTSRSSPGPFLVHSIGHSSLSKFKIRRSGPEVDAIFIV